MEESQGRLDRSGRKKSFIMMRRNIWRASDHQCDQHASPCIGVIWEFPDRTRPQNGLLKLEAYLLVVVAGHCQSPESLG